MKAHAKLNLSLDILGERPDGMHEMDMVMQSISIYDTLHIKKSDELLITADGMMLPEHNTIKSAAELFLAEAEIDGSTHVHVVKRIPEKAGLGGGSADAAAVLVALNEIYGANFSKEQLCDMGVKIGADVPFFICGGSARARGIGEVLEPIENNCNFDYLLIKPREGIDTGQAFNAFVPAEKQAIDIEKVTRALKTGQRELYYKHADNALYPASSKLCGEVADIVRKCVDTGASHAMMTGSGSCVFAVYENGDEKDRAFKYFFEQYPFVCWARDVHMAIEEY